MKNKTLLICTIIFFLIVNTNYYWEGIIGKLAMLFSLLLILIFAILCFIFFYQIFKSIKEKFTSKLRNISIVVLIIVLGLTFYKPNGIVDFEKLDGKDLLIAERGGVADCSIVFKLKENNHFFQRNVCFGIEKTTGKYSIKNDTIYFSNISLRKKDYYKFGVIIREKKHNKMLGEISLYKTKTDKMPLKIFITKNNLK
ncbi:hypothetical protein FEDK69T_30250 [Flavobacterium enshiense DK69]|uniref:Uncharacterized protein n=1 Tax=Flavobacterium enshiense DK69 TaxID=1107311 RepID=V6S761_9FLAO|nr:hypothetical protein [Flavobacterium enshiense]ESU20210.1 hypothetical protein FEDK69T_30250 [Flavobacterium enshiense DK69]KGO92018.1 hypothetical protein Q767_15830 [Flavobacterium enshiense DK69]